MRRRPGGGGNGPQALKSYQRGCAEGRAGIGAGPCGMQIATLAAVTAVFVVEVELIMRA
jgi:hypothetical protein